LRTPPSAGPDLGEVGFIESVLCRSIDDTIVCLNLKQSDKCGKTYIKKVLKRTKQNIGQQKKYLAQAGCFCYNFNMEKNREKDKVRVGVLRGGTGKYYASSLEKGGEIISHIFKNLSHKYKLVDLLIDKKGNWYVNGIPISPADLTHKVNVVWNTVSNISSILQNFSIPHTSNNVFSSTLENSREMLLKHVKSIGIQMPRSIILPLYQKDFYASPTEQSFGRGPREKYAIKKAKEVFEKFSSPWIVKTFTPDSNMGIHLAKTFGELVDSIEDGAMHEKSILVEEFISGKVASIHSLTQFRGEDIYVFPPENFTNHEKEKVIILIKDLHRHLGISHYLKSDFVFHPKRGFFLTGIDSSPDLKIGSHFYHSCEFVGVKMHHIIEHILDRALEKKI